MIEGSLFFLSKVAKLCFVPIKVQNTEVDDIVTERHPVSE